MGIENARDTIKLHRVHGGELVANYRDHTCFFMH